LAGAVEFLEQEVARKDAENKAAPAQAKLAARQHDLFNEWSGSPHPANSNTAAVLAKRLDNAIENIQWLLKQAEA
jgi:hypothetical protein